MIDDKSMIKKKMLFVNLRSFARWFCNRRAEGELAKIMVDKVPRAQTCMKSLWLARCAVGGPGRKGLVITRDGKVLRTIFEINKIIKLSSKTCLLFRK